MEQMLETQKKMWHFYTVFPAGLAFLYGNIIIFFLLPASVP